MKRIFLLICICLSLACIAQFNFQFGGGMPQRQEPVRLGIDSQDIFLGETVTFQIQVSVDDDSKDKVVMPDFPESQDYMVVARPPSTGTSSFTSIVNGKRTESHTTNTTYSYQITPKRIGQVTLPSMNVKIGSKTYRTQEVPITVPSIASSSMAKRSSGLAFSFLSQRSGLGINQTSSQNFFSRQVFATLM